MRDTSNLAYKGIQESGVAVTQRAQILDFLEATGARMTRAEIESATGIKINAVCGRVNELMKMGKLEEFARRECNVTGSMAHPAGAFNESR